jgi:hypothetical protein
MGFARSDSKLEKNVDIAFAMVLFEPVTGY